MDIRKTVTATRKTVTVTITADERVESYGTVYAGTYTLDVPARYDAGKIEAADIALDDAITTLAVA